MAKIEIVSRDESFLLGDTDCSFTLRRLHPDVVPESRRRHTRRVDSGKPEDVPRLKYDEAEVNKDVYDYIIQDWRGVLAPDGALAPCTRENKWLLPGPVKEQILVVANAVNCQGVQGASLMLLTPGAAAAPATSADRA